MTHEGPGSAPPTELCASLRSRLRTLSISMGVANRKTGMSTELSHIVGLHRSPYLSFLSRAPPPIRPTGGPVRTVDPRDLPCKTHLRCDYNKAPCSTSLMAGAKVSKTSLGLVNRLTLTLTLPVQCRMAGLSSEVLQCAPPSAPSASATSRWKKPCTTLPSRLVQIGCEVTRTSSLLTHCHRSFERWGRNHRCRSRIRRPPVVNPSWMRSSSSGAFNN